MITIGSLFSGIGGLELGLEHGLAMAGLRSRTIWQCEADPFCRAVLAKHWPEAGVYYDVRDMDVTVLQRAAIICGGFPCQDISSAGSRRGIHGPKSSLFFEFLRILDGLGHDGPAIVVVENVGRLVRAGLDEVVAGLCYRGFTVDATRMRAADVGAPHRRERVFLVGFHAERCEQLARRLREERVADANALGHGAGGVEVLDRRGEGSPRNESDRRGLSVELHPGGPAGPGPCAQPGLGRAADGLPGGLVGPLPEGGWPAGRGQPQKAGEAPRVAPRVPCLTRWRTAALGNAVVPQCAAHVALHVAKTIEACMSAGKE